MKFKAKVRTFGTYSFGVTIPIETAKKLKLGKEYHFDVQKT